jgi:phospholipid/cholesterol/gamma-HCH transport system ATP-binding protein
MIKVHQVEKSFDGKPVLRGVSFEIRKGETLAIIGRSGSGKSVLLKIIVGLLKPDSGYVDIEGIRVDQADRQTLYTLRERVGYVFQNAALFDSMNVLENLTVGLRERGIRDRRVLEEEAQLRLQQVDLLPLRLDDDAAFATAWRRIATKVPSELSGGMKKRVGVARALVGMPEYVFYDEPTTGLDPITSEQIDRLVMHLANQLDVTSVVITHDIFSVRNVADRVIMLYDGMIRFQGTPDEMSVSEDPAVKEFLVRYGSDSGEENAISP